MRHKVVSRGFLHWEECLPDKHTPVKATHVHDKRVCVRVCHTGVPLHCQPSFLNKRQEGFDLYESIFVFRTFQCTTNFNTSMCICVSLSRLCVCAFVCVCACICMFDFVFVVLWASTVKGTWLPTGLWFTANHECWFTEVKQCLTRLISTDSN